jgi:hypothetical protein
MIRGIHCRFLRLGTGKKEDDDFGQERNGFEIPTHL